ncbi:MAG: hypothetical protein IPN63_00520 [Gammaproteobacteria bacterium]|nr:hypothetical protein [Gammaproteobacteria bacterium]
MSEGAAGTASAYGKLIEEVFIKPIRTVVVVDDEFPTFDALLDKEKGNSSPEWKLEDVKRAREIIDFCREEKRLWMVEIHSGRQSASLDVESEAASHLHQSDLMILDFHLNQERPDDGSDAIGILRRLAENDHFNLVVVYTKGYEQAGGEIARVVQEISLGLCSADERLTLHEKNMTEVMRRLGEWEDCEANIASRIKDEIDDGIFLKVRTLPPGNIDWNKVCEWPELQALKALVADAPGDLKSQLKLFVKWALHQRQAALVEKEKLKLTEGDFSTVGVDSGGESGTNWIRTDRLFVTVVSKSNEPSLLPGKLLAALHHWNPEPHRLLMSKMRAELDERGVLAEGKVLGNPYLQAGWLDDYLTEDRDERAWKIHSTVNRHWEGLGDAIRSGVEGFAERLAVQLTGKGREDDIQRWYPSLDQKDVRSHINRYVSSKPIIEGGHLTTGHVLRLDDGKRDYSYWLCLSPACDLVPGRKSSGWPKRLGNHTPFIAVQLFHAERDEALSNAFGGNHLFLEIDNKLKCFSFTPLPVAKGDAAGARTPNPKWEQMFAANQGRFDAADKTLVLARASGGDEGLCFNTANACVVAQLRYEYALNLLQRLGSNLSRVGLDFVEISRNSEGDGQTDT